MSLQVLPRTRGMERPGKMITIVPFESFNVEDEPSVRQQCYAEWLQSFDIWTLTCEEKADWIKVR